MSYNSRVYRQRNAHTHDEGKKEKFFSKENDAGKTKNKTAFFQPKLQVNEPGDKYEQEADAVAGKVVSKAGKGAGLQSKNIGSIQRLATPVEDEKLGTNDARMSKDKLIQEMPVQRMGGEQEKDKKEHIQKMENPEKDKKESIQKMDNPEKEKKENIQKKESSDKKEEQLQKKEDPLKEEKAGGAIQKKPAGQKTAAGPGLSSAIESSAGKGEAMPAKTRKEMNNSFGIDFNHVRIHKGSDAAAMNKELDAQAFTHGHDIFFDEGKFDPDSPGGKFLLAHELTHVVQQGAEPLKKIQRDGKPAGKTLFDNFGDKFPDSVDIIKKSPEAMLLIKDATSAGVEFGGYSEDGPAKDTWPYTIGNKVYVPKARKTDKLGAVSDFLFELNNGLHKAGFQKLIAEARSGSKGTLNAKEYARKTVALEVEGLLRLGKVWVEMKKAQPKGENWSSYDETFYLSTYEEFKSGKKSKDQIVTEVLQRVYPEGVDKGKTVEQFYMDQYNRLSGGK